MCYVDIIKAFRILAYTLVKKLKSVKRRLRFDVALILLLNHKRFHKAIFFLPIAIGGEAGSRLWLHLVQHNDTHCIVTIYKHGDK